MTNCYLSTSLGICVTSRLYILIQSETFSISTQKKNSLMALSLINNMMIPSKKNQIPLID